jgi:hypothetical protein
MVQVLISGDRPVKPPGRRGGIVPRPSDAETLSDGTAFPPALRLAPPFPVVDNRGH